MREFQRSRDRERKPSRKFGGDFKADRPRGKFRRDSDESPRRFGGGSGGRFRRDSEGSDRQGPEMFEVICDNCGRDCTVPFKPTTSKPVYCLDCFRKMDDSSGKGSFEPRGRSDSSAEALASINYKLDKIMKAMNLK
jgi:CxxC-x17-CxxC domain-containing protein